MPKNRSSNTPQRAQKKAPQQALITQSAIQDIAGVVLAVIALAMGLAILIPQTAPVTAACARGLSICFGAGAILVPIALLGLAITFFVPTSAPLTARVALGLLGIVVAILAMLSLAYPGAPDNPDVVLGAEAASASGGWVGGAIAWALLSSVGQVVGYVVLSGVIVAGLIVCGVSISSIIAKARNAMYSAHERHVERIAAREKDTLRRGERKGEEALKKTRLGSPQAKVATSFIGARKTSVLKRARKDEPSYWEADDAPYASSPLATGGYASFPAAAFDGTAALDVMSNPEANVELGVPDFITAAAHPETLRAAERHPRTTPLRRAKAEAKPTRAGATQKGGDIEAKGARAYGLPPMRMISSTPKSAFRATDERELKQTAARLQATLAEFGLKSRVVGWISGPLVTTFKIAMGEGERVSRIVNLEDDIALSLASESVRIYAPIAGTSLVGIEIPNSERQEVLLGDVLPEAKGGPLEFAIGRDVSGRPVVEDLASMPHLLIAGATGAGKSVMINSIIMSILMRATPEEVRLIMVDPKRVELSGYNELPHLYVPVVTEPKKAAGALAWAVGEMDRRNRALEALGVKNIKSFNARVAKERAAGKEDVPSPLPYFVIIIDELADLMMVAGKDVEASIVRIAQLGRAAGVHLIVATQRPSVDVVTGLIKANIESRIAFSVASSTDSRVIIDQKGAERLLGRGDMLFRPGGRGLRRVLGAYVSEEEIERVVAYIKERSAVDYHEEVLSTSPGSNGPAAPEEEDSDDPLVWEAATLVVENKMGSTSMLQRHLKVGYARAGRIMDMLETKGIVGPASGSKPRDVLMDLDQLGELMGARAQE